MAKSGEKIVRRGIYLYIDGKQVKASITEIEREMRKIERAQKTMIVGSEEYVRAGEKIRSLKGILVEHRMQLRAVTTETNQAALSFGKMADAFNKYAGMVTGALAGITGLTLTVRKATQAYASMEEAQSQVIKYTGLSKEAVKELNEELLKIDTRTPRERLNELAGDAGRLGLNTKEAILEFVEAADIINIALGEDLGKDAVKNIGKLAMMFGEDKTKGLRGAMLATASAINEVAQNSSACEPYLVQFAARVAGAANLAKISQADIIGFGAVLDQNMNQVEMAGTAFQKVLMKMYQDPAKFAKIAGKDVKEFTKLLREDANEAMLQFIQSLSHRGGLEALAPLFNKMGLDGVRAAGVLSVMANNIDRIRIEQKRANEAYQEGTSALEEAEIKNNTVQANLEKKIKDFNEFVIVLGEKLLPVAGKLITTGSLGIKTLGTITTFLIENKGAVIAVAASLGGYYLAANSAAIATNAFMLITRTLKISLNVLKGALLLGQAAFYLLTGQIQKATIAMRAFSIVTKASPVGALVATVIALAGAIYLLTKRISSAEKAQKSLNKIQQEAASSVAAQRNEIDSLLKVAQDETLSKEARLKAIAELNEIAPDYLKNLSLENIRTQDAKKAVDEYVESLMNKERIKLAIARKGEIEQEFKEKTKGLTGPRWLKSLPVIGSTMSVAYTLVINDEYKKDIAELKAEDEALTEFLKEQQKARLENEPPIKESESLQIEPDTDEKEIEKNKREAINKIVTEFEKKKNEIRKQYIDGDIKTQEEYQAQLRQIEMESLQAIMKINGLKEKEQAEYQAKYLELQVELRKKLEQISSDITTDSEDEFDKQIKVLRKKRQELEQDIQKAFDLHVLKESERQERLIDLKRYYAEKEGEVTIKKLEKEAQEEKEHADRLMKSYIEKHKQEIKDLEETGKVGLFSTFRGIKQIRELYQKQLEELITSGLNGEQLANAVEELDGIFEPILQREGRKLAELAQDMGSVFAESLSGEEGILKSMLKGNLVLMLEYMRQKIQYAKMSALADAVVSGLKPGKIAKMFAEIAVIEAAFQAAIHQVNSFDTGGYTGNGKWDEPAGIVHKNEFVANRFTVANPSVKPILDLFDAAQRTGTTGSLTSADIMAVAGGKNTSRRERQIKTLSGEKVQDPQNGALLSVLSQVKRTLEQVNERFESPIIAETYATGKGGINEAQNLVSKMEANASRRRIR